MLKKYKFKIIKKVQSDATTYKVRGAPARSHIKYGCFTQNNFFYYNAVYKIITISYFLSEFI